MLHRAYPYNLVSSGAQPTNKVLIVLATDVQKLLAIEKKNHNLHFYTLNNMEWTTDCVWGKQWLKILDHQLNSCKQ